MRLLGRESAWRLGRGLYMVARGESVNDMETNGEAALMNSCAAAFRRKRRSAPFIAYDIGANLGRWSLTMLNAAHNANIECTIELFEPVPGAFSRLEAAFAGERVVRLHQLAVSNRTGVAEMQIVGEFAGTNSLVQGAATANEILSVRTETVPEIMRRLDHHSVQLLKIDAEGHDLEIMRGMKPVLSLGQVEVAQFEYNARWLSSAGSMRAVFDLADETSYRVCRLTRNGLEAYSCWNSEIDRFFEANYALVRRDILLDLDHREMRWSDSNVLVH